MDEGGRDNQGIADHLDEKAMEHSVKGLSSSRDENAMEVNTGQLGFEPDVSIEVDNMLQHDEDFKSPSLSVLESPQGSLDSRSSTNVRSGMNRASDLFMAVSVSAEINKTKIRDLACSAMEELTKMALEGEPLWHRKGENETETLNGFEYMKEFGSVDATLKEIMRMVEVGDLQCLPNLDTNTEFSFECEDRRMLPKEREEYFHNEASRQIGLVSMNHIRVVELLMDVNQWSLTFANIISRAKLLGVLSTEADANYDERLQVMTVELHLPTALVPTRESQYVRYCKQLAYGTWGVVDISLENLFPYPASRFRRRSSGCLIQELPNGCSKVIWVEHVAVDNRLVHSIYRPIVNSGFAFSAKRWVATLIRHCHWLTTLSAKNFPTHDCVLIPQAGRESLLKLAERMTRSFWGDISASIENLWIPLPISGAEDIRVMTKGSIPVPGMTPSTKIVFTTSLSLPIPRKRLFDFLRDENSRTKWDTRLYGRIIRELAFVINGDNPANRVSILQVNATLSEIEILYLQESFTDDTGSYVIYAPVDVFAMSGVLNGGNPEIVNILPCGFAILPERLTLQGQEDVHGSLLTLAFHIIDRTSTKEFIPPESLITIYNIITETASLIKTALISDNLKEKNLGGDD